MQKVINLNGTDGFKVLLTGKKSQAAALNLPPGEATSERQNRHPDSEQTLLLVEGTLRAEVEEDTFEMKEGDVVIIPCNTGHRFINTGKNRARAFTTYAPPNY